MVTGCVTHPLGVFVTPHPGCAQIELYHAGNYPLLGAQVGQCLWSEGAGAYIHPPPPYSINGTSTNQLTNQPTTEQAGEHPIRARASASRARVSGKNGGLRCSVVCVCACASERVLHSLPPLHQHTHSHTLTHTTNHHPSQMREREAPLQAIRPHLRRAPWSAIPFRPHSALPLSPSVTLPILSPSQA